MSRKYHKLTEFLEEKAAQAIHTINLNLENVEKIIESLLPPSAKAHPQWWANQTKTHTRPQARAWTSAGYKVETVNLARGTISFCRIENSKASSQKAENLVTKENAEFLPNPPKDWFWEGNVVEVLAQHLERQGWHLVSKADTALKERGLDIHAKKSNQEMLFEVKGYPSISYRDPRRLLETKRTSPTLQAQQWYSHALLKVLRLQTQYPDAIVAIALPDFPRYKKLFEETRPAIQKLNLQVWGVSETGEVNIW